MGNKCCKGLPFCVAGAANECCENARLSVAPGRGTGQNSDQCPKHARQMLAEAIFSCLIGAPNSTKIGPMLAECGPNRAKFGRVRTKLARVRPILVKIGPMLFGARRTKITRRPPPIAFFAHVSGMFRVLSSAPGAFLGAFWGQLLDNIGARCDRRR